MVVTLTFASSVLVSLTACGVTSERLGDAPPCDASDESRFDPESGATPKWAREWHVGESGATGGGRVTAVDATGDNSMFDLVYSCVGLVEPGWAEVSTQGDVRVGVEDYKYRFGDLIVGDDMYRVDVVLAPIDSSRFDFGVAYYRAGVQARAADVGYGATAVQRMRELGVL